MDSKPLLPQSRLSRKEANNAGISPWDERGGVAIIYLVQPRNSPITRRRFSVSRWCCTLITRERALGNVSRFSSVRGGVKRSCVTYIHPTTTAGSSCRRDLAAPTTWTLLRTSKRPSRHAASQPTQYFGELQFGKELETGTGSKVARQSGVSVNVLGPWPLERDTASC
jgi:hypothetical protein